MTLTARALAPGDRLNHLEAVWGDAPAAQAGARAATAWVATNGEEVVGLAVVIEQPSGPRIHGLWISDAASPRAVLAAFGAALPGRRLTLLAHDPPAALAGETAAAGFEPLYDHVLVARSLHDTRPPAQRPLALQRFEAVGHRGLLTLLTRLWAGGGGPTGLSPAAELADLTHGARGRTGFPDRSLWRVAYLAGEPVGVALGQRLQHDPRVAVLLYFGILPELRGLGLGHVLHAEALWTLRLAGAERYEDGTPWANAPMRRVFARAGCEPRGSCALFVRPGELGLAAVFGGTGDAPASSPTLLRTVPVRR